MSDAQSTSSLITQKKKKKKKRVIAKYESFESRYYFRRAAFSLLTSSASTTPLQPRSINAGNRRRLPFLVPRQSPHYAFQRRWNNDEARRREPVEAESDKGNKKDTEDASEDVTAKEEKREATEGTEPIKPMPAETATVTEVKPRTISQNLEECANSDPDATEEGGAQTESEPTSNEAREAAPRPPSGPARFRYVEQPASPKETVFISNLYFDVTADDLRKKMEDFGVVENVTIVHDARGISRG